MVVKYPVGICPNIVYTALLSWFSNTYLVNPPVSGEDLAGSDNVHRHPDLLALRGP